ncbi:TSCPD domain-containing protein [Ruegeria atlantica]|uniref:TSCPD domain-containing protein n=1 Tax=Ruegeria atlantica TaxID=81569 RepID=UPI001479A796|nr:hypothetical protein [Ruegeria atlantica]
MTMRERQILPNRRLVETRRVETAFGQTAFISVGYDPAEPLRPREVFYSAGLKSGSDLEFLLHDMCVLVSKLLQCGMPPEDVAKSLSRQETAIGDITHASLFGWILDAVCVPPEWAAAYDAALVETRHPGVNADKTEVQK